MNSIERWARARKWPKWRFALEAGPLMYALDIDAGMYMCVTEPAYAECQGPSDPVCGRARFSMHGCNGNGPTRRAFIKWMNSQR